MPSDFMTDTVSAVSDTVPSVASVFVMPCVLQLHAISQVSMPASVLVSAIIVATRMVWPEDCSESTPLFSSIKWSWSLKRGERRCIVQGWVVNKNIECTENSVHKTVYAADIVLEQW